MTKRNARKIERTIPLKVVHDDIMRDNKNATITTKRMRVWLRTNMRDVHEHNNAWVFSQSEYDKVRGHFDPKYAKALAAPARPKRSRKIDQVTDIADAKPADA